MDVHKSVFSNKPYEHQDTTLLLSAIVTQAAEKQKAAAKAQRQFVDQQLAAAAPKPAEWRDTRWCREWFTR